MCKTMKTLQVNDIFPTNQGGSVTVIDIVNNLNITIKHNDRYGHTQTIALNNLKRGEAKNPYHPSVCGVGYPGYGIHRPTVNGKHTPGYTAWTGMLERCYSPKYHETRPTYVECTVDPRWHNFQVFAEWYYNNPFNYPGYQLDKDILYPGNKVYGPDTCTLVPSVINNLFKDVSQCLSNNNLPMGVVLHRRRYVAKFGRLRLGSYDTAEQADQAYQNYKRTLLLSTAEEYKHVIDPRVYYAILGPNT